MGVLHIILKVGHPKIMLTWIKAAFNNNATEHTCSISSIQFNRRWMMCGVTHNFESGPPKDHFNLNWLINLTEKPGIYVKHLTAM
jgi:hypothetical protein